MDMVSYFQVQLNFRRGFQHNKINVHGVMVHFGHNSGIYTSVQGVCQEVDIKQKNQVRS